MEIGDLKNTVAIGDFKNTVAIGNLIAFVTDSKCFISFIDNNDEEREKIPEKWSS